jgi:hypothetical protein
MMRFRDIAAERRGCEMFIRHAICAQQESKQSAEIWVTDNELGNFGLPN